MMEIQSGFAPAGAFQIVLQLDEQVGHMRIEIPVRRFPVLADRKAQVAPVGAFQVGRPGPGMEFA